MRGRFADFARGHVIAVLSTLAATWGHFALDSQENVAKIPFALYFVSVVVTAWLGGTTPAIVALILGVIATTITAFSETGMSAQGPADAIALIVYTGISAASIWLFHRAASDHRAAEQKARENEELTAKLKVSDRRKDEFLALLAHELRNPLAPIRTGLEVLDRPGVDPERQSQVRRTMSRQLDQLTRIVDDLLDVSRFLQGQMRLHKETIDLREVIDSALETCHPILEHNDHLVQFVRPKVPIYVYADHVRLAQVVSNLLTNAAKYTPRHGKIRILVEANAAGTSLHVQDNGIGIPIESQSQIFELFTQVNTSETRDHGGLGLGLTIVRQLTQLHGGTATVYSEGPGLGSKFTINLPDADPPRARSTDTVCGLSDTQISIPMPAARNRPAVLIVDDNIDAADTLSALLSFDGYETLVAHDGPTALAKFDEFSPPVVLLDIGMPGMDGYQVARELRSRTEAARTRIIALTGWGSERDRQRTREAGFDEHLVKPIEYDHLAQLLQERRTVSRS